jgi:hypothetical protein
MKGILGKKKIKLPWKVMLEVLRKLRLMLLNQGSK